MPQAINNEDWLYRAGRLCGGLLACCLLAGPALADEESAPAFTLSGFGTLGAARTSTDELEFVRDLTQAKGAERSWDAHLDSLLGVQANWKFSDDLDAVVQAVSHYRYDRTFRPDVTRAFLRYEPTPLVSLRAGRLGTEFFMLADSRQVGYSYLTVRPVGDFFWALPFYSIDGADITFSQQVGEGVLRSKLYYGYADTSLPRGDQEWNISGSPMIGGYLEYHQGPWQLRASYANILFKSDLPLGSLLSMVSPANRAQIAAYLSTDNKRGHYYSLGAVYDDGPWQVQLMLNRIEQRSNAFESSTAGYALAGYRIGEVTPYVGYSRVFSTPRANAFGGMDGTLLRIALLEGHAVQWTSIVGARWDLAHNVALKAQWDGIHSDRTTFFPYRNDIANKPWSGRMDVFSLTLDFIF